MKAAKKTKLLVRYDHDSQQFMDGNGESLQKELVKQTYMCPGSAEYTAGAYQAASFLVLGMPLPTRTN